MMGKPDHTTKGDEPFGRVVLVPQKGVAVVHWELMVEVVISLAHRNDCRDEVVSRSVDIVEWGGAKPVSNRIKAEGSL